MGFARADGRPAFGEGNVVYEAGLEVGLAVVDLIAEPFQVGLGRDLEIAVRIRFGPGGQIAAADAMAVFALGAKQRRRFH